jgi:type VI secretion system secreted protein VgrG
MQVPRINQEVVVDFLEGDPDQPLITGRVYNAEQMPPWELPANATQSGLLTRSSKTGVYSNANALRFEDKKGEEQLWLHAEKDQLTEVEHDEDKWVGNDRRKTIDRDETNHIKRDRTETVDRNEKINVHGWRTEEVDLDETITIHKNRTETVDLNETISIGINRTESVGANETVSIGANRTETVGGMQTETVSLADVQTIGLAKMLNVGLGYSVNVGAAMNTIVGGFKMEQVGLYKSVSVLGGDYVVNVPSGNHTFTVNQHVVISAGGANSKITMTDESITLQVGEASLVLKSNGDITLSGNDLKNAFSGKIVDAASEIHDN